MSNFIAKGRNGVLVIEDASTASVYFQLDPTFDGIQGTQGPTGAASTVPGPQGTAGFQGTQGKVGPRGYQAFQGPQGMEGAAGYDGFQGFTGVQGKDGVQGVDGPQGFRGFQGNDGVQGFTGVQGKDGVQGIDGVQGVDGLQGFRGYQGFQGSAGVQGYQGYQGPIAMQPMPVSDGTLHANPFDYSTNCLALMSPEFDFTQPTDITNGSGAFTVAISSNVMTVDIDPTESIVHKLSIGQWVQFRNSSYYANSMWTYGTGWTTHSFLDGCDATPATVASVSGNIFTLTLQSPHGFTAGNYIAIAAGDFGDAPGNNVYQILTTPTAYTLTFAYLCFDADLSGASCVIFSTAQVKTIPNAHSFTCDFIHGNQTTTIEAGTSAHLYNAGFSMPMPVNTRFRILDVSLIVSARPGAVVGNMTCNTDPLFDIGGSGIKVFCVDEFGQPCGNSEGYGKAWNAFGAYVLTASLPVGTPSWMRIAQATQYSVPIGALPSIYSFPRLQARVNTSGDFGTDVCKGRFVFHGYLIQV